MNEGQKNNELANTTAIQQLQNRLNEEKTVQAINRLLDRIDTLEKSVGHLTTIIQQGPGMIAMTMDMVDEGYKKADASGISIENRLSTALQIAEKLTAPPMVEKLNGLLAFADQIPGLIAMTTDMVDESLKKANERGLDLETRLMAALQIAEKFTDPKMTKKLDSLFELADQAPGLIAMVMDMIDEEIKNSPLKELDLNALLEVGTQISHAVIDAKYLPDAKVGGIFSMIKTMKDPDRQRAIGYLMNIAKSFGQTIK